MRAATGGAPGPHAAAAAWGEEGQGSERSFRRQAETEWNGLCPDEDSCHLLKKVDENFSLRCPSAKKTGLLQDYRPAGRRGER